MDIISYRRTVTQLTQDLATLEVHARNLDMENSQVSLHELNEHIKNDRFNLAVLGEFRRGKSTLINALLRTPEPIVPVSVVPCTASVNRITYAPEPKAMVEMTDGSKELIDIRELKDYATQRGTKSDGVKEVTIWYPTVYCANNVDLYDTPGLNDSPEMTRATNEVISRMDVAIFVLMAQVNFSESEINFLGERLLTSDVGRVIFAVTRMDGYSPEDQELILENIRERVEERVLGKAEELYEDEPERLEEFKQKLGSIQIYGVSSTMAIEARKNHDSELLEKSGYPAFEKAIDELLTKERGRVMLEKQTGAILKASNDIFNVIQARMVPLTMDEGEYEAACKTAEQEMDAINKELKAELARLDKAEEKITKDVRDTWVGYVEKIKEDVNTIASQLDISRADMSARKREKTVQNIWEKQMCPAISRRLQIYSEKIQDQINEAVGKECDKMNDYSIRVSEHLSNIADAFKLKKEITIADGALGTALNFLLFGGGNIMTGYKIAGVKGALVGCLSGGGIALGSATLLGGLAGFLGLAGWPVIVAAGALAGLAGLLGGNAITRKIFGGPITNQFKQDFARITCEELDKTLKEQKTEAMICDHIAKTFKVIKEEITANTTDMLKDLQKSLQDSRTDYAAKKAQAQSKLQTYKTILEDLSVITERTTGVRKDYDLDPA